MNARTTAAQILHRVLYQSAYANRTLSTTLNRSSLSPQDKGFATELVYGVLRNKIHIDFILDKLAQKGLDSIDSRVLMHLRLAIYQLRFLDRVPDHAAVSEAIHLIKEETDNRLGGFANAVLRNYLRKKDASWLKQEEISQWGLFWSHPQWLVERYIRQYGKETALERLKVQNTPSKLCIRINPVWGSVAKFKEVTSPYSLEVEDCKYSAQGLVCSEQSMVKLLQIETDFPTSFLIQDESSQIVAEWLNPQNGENVLDACAAPGGKTTHLALLAPQAHVIANEANPKKARFIQQNLQKQGCTNVEITTQDARKSWDRLFDKILLDAPCSALGLVQKQPEIRYRRTETELKDFATRQLELLEAVSQQLNEKGVLVYSVCSDMKEETSQVVKQFLQKNTNFSLDSNIPEKWKPLQTNEGCLQMSPLLGEMDAFFVAKFQKK